MKKLYAWLIAFAGIPAETVIITGWCLLVNWILGILMPRLPGILGDFLDEKEIIPLLGTYFIISTGNWFVGRSNKVSFSKRGNRFLAVAAVTIGIIIYIGVQIFRHRFPEDTDFWMLFSILYAMGIYAYGLIRGVLKLRKTLDAAPAPVQKQEQAPAKSVPAPKKAEQPPLKPYAPAKETPAEKPRITICFTPEMPKQEQDMILKASQELRTLFPQCEVVVMGAASISLGGEVGFGPKQLVENAVVGTQYDAGKILENMKKAKRQLTGTEFFVFFVERDLYTTATPGKWCFGLALASAGVNVQSTYRYRNLTEEERLRCIRRILRHELGHLFRLCETPGRTNTIRKSGMHCTNPNCSMNRTNNTAELVMRSELEEQEKSYFCPQCTEELKAFFEKRSRAKVQ